MEINEESLKEQLKLHKKLNKNLKEYGELVTELNDYRKDHRTFRNVREDLLNVIYDKYDYDQILNCDGDIMYITMRDSHYFEGKRVLWDLSLSEETYEIEEIVETDSEGAFDFVHYEVQVKK